MRSTATTLAFAAALSAAACSSAVYGPVEVVQPRQPVTATFVLHPSKDVTVQNAAQWQKRSLNDQPWLMVGSNGEGGAWFTYLQFPVHVLPAEATVAGASLIMQRMRDIVLPEGAEQFPVHVWRLTENWVETETTWVRQPHVESSPLATVDLYAGALADEIDLTIAVQDALSRGDAWLDLLVTPAVYDVDFRVRWPSREGASEFEPDELEGFERVEPTATPQEAASRSNDVELRVHFAP
jgi:hypothetical protein